MYKCKDGQENNILQIVSLKLHTNIVMKKELVIDLKY